VYFVDWLSKNSTLLSGNLRKRRRHVVCSLGQSAVFRNFNSANYFLHSTIRNYTKYQHPDQPDPRKTTINGRVNFLTVLYNNIIYILSGCLATYR